MGQQDTKDAVVGGEGEKKEAPTKRVFGDEDRYKRCFEIEWIDHGPVGWKEEEGEIKEKSVFVTQVFSRNECFHVCELLGSLSKHYWL